MEKIDGRKIWSYFDTQTTARSASNAQIRRADGHVVNTYFELAKKVAELQFLNRDHVLLFRGQASDYKTVKGNSMLKARLFRLNGMRPLTQAQLEKRFKTLRWAEEELVRQYVAAGLQGRERLKRHRTIRWAILQHYEVCPTPLIDVSQSLRIAASFASLDNRSDAAFVFALGVPSLGGAVTASAEAGLEVVRLSSACPPEAVRPHLQEGYLLGEYPEIADYEQNAHYSYYEMDFGRRLLAKFRFDPATLWKSKNFPRVPDEALYPKEHRDRLLNITEEIKATLEEAS
jgi:hypothetical protein